MSVKLIFVKGGPGSGFRGHAGLSGVHGGSKPRGGGGSTITSIERKIRNKPNEEAYTLSLGGEILGHTEGYGAKVDPISQMEANPGAITIHNHPSGGTFSPIDIRRASQYDQSEMRVVGPDGSTFVMKLPRKGEKGWKSSTEIAKWMGKNKFGETPVNTWATKIVLAGYKLEGLEFSLAGKEIRYWLRRLRWHEFVKDHPAYKYTEIGVRPMSDIPKEMLIVVEKGGPKSGHHGHRGLPGVHGGSRPSGAGGGGLYTGLSDKVSKALEEYESKHRRPDAIHTVETGTMFSEDGTQIIGEKTGSLMSLNISPGNYEDAIFTHNHPPSNAVRKFGGIVIKFNKNGVSQPPSLSDVTFAISNNLREMRVTGFKVGKPVTFRMRRIGNEWPELGRYWSSNFQGFMESNLDKEINPSLASYNVLNAFWEQAASDTGFVYEVVE